MFQIETQYKYGCVKKVDISIFFRYTSTNYSPLNSLSVPSVLVKLSVTQNAKADNTSEYALKELGNRGNCGEGTRTKKPANLAGSHRTGLMVRGRVKMQIKGIIYIRINTDIRNYHQTRPGASASLWTGSLAAISFLG